MLPNLDKLVAKCKSLGLEPKASGKRLSKDDCVSLLRAHYMPEGGLPYEELEPMLCFAEWNLKPAEQEHAWTSKNWAAQVKLNGCRIVLHFVKDVGVFAHSRTVSVKTYRFQDLTPSLLIKDYVPNFSATVDAEIMIQKPVDTRPYTTKGEVTKSSLHSTTAVLHLAPESGLKLQAEQDAAFEFHVFDVMRWQGHDLVKLKSKQTEREIVRQDLAKLVREDATLRRWFYFPALVVENKKSFFEKVVKEGGEGVILKNLFAPYEASSSRNRDAWVKVKKRIEFDAFVSDFERGDEEAGYRNMVGALLFSVNLKGGGTHLLAKCSNLTMEQRTALTIYDPATDTVTMNPMAYFKVAEISGQDVSPRSLRLSHATIDRFRPKEGADAKRAEDCVVEMADLKAAAEWVG